MGTALWIGGSVLLVLLVLVAAWRLRRAAHTVDRILAEEAERTSSEDTLPIASAPDEHRRPGAW